MSGKKPPPGFADLSDVSNAALKDCFSVIGVVVDCMPPKLTSRLEYQVTFRIQDPRLRDAVYGSEGLKIRWFAKQPQNLPQINAIGDVVLVRDGQVSEYRNEKLLISNHRAAVLVFSGAVLPSPAFKLDYVSGNATLPYHGTDGQRGCLTPVVQEYIIEMKNDLNVEVRKLSNAESGPLAAQAMSTPRPNRQPGQSGPPAPQYAGFHKFRLVKDLQHRVFSDLCVEVVKKFPNNYGKCELYVTDYTANEQMFYYAPPEEKHDLVRDGDQFGYHGPPKRNWPGPFGFMVLRVTLVEPHAGFAIHQIEEGDEILMQNVKIKFTPNNNKLEGDMWPDQYAPSKVQIQKITPKFPQIQDLRLRKDEYYSERRAITEKAEQANAEVEVKLSKSEKKKQKKLRKQEEARRKAEQEAAHAERKIQANPHVRCSFIDHPLTTIPHILDPDNVRHTNTLATGESYILPFVNARHHIKARVVDFFPPRLEDFAIKLSQADINDDKSDFSVDMIWDNSPPRWEWSFALHLEEVSSATTGAGTSPRSRIWVNVGHLEAQHLFGNSVDDPANLREDTALLNKLREKLYILWGDLEEQKRTEGEKEEVRKVKRMRLDNDVNGETEEKKPSNLPFNCCLAEYGELRDGGSKDDIADWERRYMMFGVLIN